MKLSSQSFFWRAICNMLHFMNRHVGKSIWTLLSVYFLFTLCPFSAQADIFELGPMREIVHAIRTNNALNAALVLKNNPDFKVTERWEGRTLLALALTPGERWKEENEIIVDLLLQISPELLSMRASLSSPYLPLMVLLQNYENATHSGNHSEMEWARKAVRFFLKKQVSMRARDFDHEDIPLVLLDKGHWNTLQMLKKEGLDLGAYYRYPYNRAHANYSLLGVSVHRALENASNKLNSQFVNDIERLLKIGASPLLPGDDHADMPIYIEVFANMVHAAEAGMADEFYVLSRIFSLFTRFGVMWNERVYIYSKYEALGRNDPFPIIAVRMGSTLLTKELAGMGANFNVSNEDGMTPLMYAALDGNLEIAETLIAHGANVNGQQDGNGLTAIHHAIRGLRYAGFEKTRKMIELLLRNGADPYIRSHVHNLHEFTEMHKPKKHLGFYLFPGESEAVENYGRLQNYFSGPEFQRLVHQSKSMRQAIRLFHEDETHGTGGNSCSLLIERPANVRYLN